MSDASFIPGPVTSLPSCGANGTQQQDQQPAPDDYTPEAYAPENEPRDEDAGPSEVEIKEYMKDDHAIAARQRSGNTGCIWPLMSDSRPCILRS